MPIDITMVKRVALVAVLGTVVLAGCSSKQDPSKKNFGAAIGQYLDKNGDLCLTMAKWPVDVTESDMKQEKSWPSGPAAKMNALAAVGLVSGTEVEKSDKLFFTVYRFKVKRYVLTATGKRFYKEKEVDQFNIIGGTTTKVKQGDICYGKMSLAKVVKWEGPMKLGDYQEASVKYLYKIDGLADWTNNPAVRAAFPQMAQIIDDAGKKEQSQGVKLTSEGWEPIGLDR